MKHILITGVNSYVGNAAERYLAEYNAVHRESYRVDKVSLREGIQGLSSFADPPYDALIHVAGLAHADVGKVSEETKRLYNKINRDLTLETARWAKAAGISQFIYLSSIIVYGESAGAGQRKHITADTEPAPANFYGDSKLQAELGLKELETEDFHVAVLRLPMVYGRNSRGNFSALVKLAEKLPVFPDIKNERSMIYVENLAEFLRLLIENGRGGLFFPQNSEYVTTAQLVKAIGAAEGKRIFLWKALNPFVKLASRMPGKIGGLANKAFGSVTIDRELSGSLEEYQRFSFEESVKKSVKQTG